MRAIRRGEAVRPLPPHARSLADLTYELGGVRFGVDDFMAPPPHGRAADPEARRDRAGALRHGQRPGEPLDQLLDREVDDRDARRRRAPRRRDRQPGRSLRGLRAAAARLGLRGRHDPQCPEDVLGRGLARGRRRRRTLRGPSPGPGHGEPAARRHPGPDVQAAARPPAGRRLQLLDRRELRAGRGGRGRRGPAAGRLLRRDGSGGRPAWRPTRTGNWSPRTAWRWAGSASAPACATSAASACWCWRTAKRSTAGGSCRPAGAISPASPTARRPASAG